MKLALAIALTALLAACGGGGGDGGDGASPAPTSRGQVLVELYGDSTRRVTNGTGAPDASVQAEAALRHEGFAVTIDNRGVGGTLSVDLLVGWEQRMRESQAKIVGINHGINDANRSDDQYADAMRELIKVAQAAGKTVLIETPNPVLPPHNSQGVQAKAEISRRIALETGAKLCDINAKFVNGWHVDHHHLPDGIHPGSLGHALLADWLVGCLRPLL